MIINTNTTIAELLNMKLETPFKHDGYNFTTIEDLSECTDEFLTCLMRDDFISYSEMALGKACNRLAIVLPRTIKEI